MCLALPAEIIKITGEDAVANVDGVAMPISLALLDDVAVGDYVVMHVGFALSKIDRTEAEKQLALMASARQFSGSLEAAE